MSYIEELNMIFMKTEKKYDMRDTQSNIEGSLLTLIFAVLFFLFSGPADAGVYLDSAHGDETSGVNRGGSSGFPTDYPEGFCAHCHEQHASIGGSEPGPTGGPSDYLLFYTNHTSQTDNFCYKCHAGSGSYQYGGSIINLSYSYRAGRWVDSVDDILESFSYSSPGTSHNLDNISTFIDAEWSSYTSDSNPCNACHNPHAAQGDPLGTGGGTTSAKTTVLANRGWPVSRPSLHNTNNTTWGLWGDGSGEKMSDYASSVGDTYQAPYKYNSTTAYEPDGSSTTNGSNLADYVTFCTDCHDGSNTIYSTTLGRNLYTFNWADEKHGGADATNDIIDWYGGTEPCEPCPDGTDDFDDLIVPFNESAVTDYVLSCTDCHEPHGSANKYLIRKGVNGGTATTSLTRLDYSAGNEQERDEMVDGMKSLCGKCHDTSVANIRDLHHNVWLGDWEKCTYCHNPDANDKRSCLLCHYHGNSTIPGVVDWELPDISYGERLF